MTPEALAVTIHASNTTGAAPLETTLSAIASGGTGTYPSFLWTFGNAGAGSGPTVAYTFSTPGDYRVQINVTDSSGRSATSAVWVNVTAGSGPTGPGTAFSPLVIAGIGVAGLAGAIGGGLLVGRWLTARRSNGESEPDPVRPRPSPEGEVARPGAGPSAGAAAVPNGLPHVGAEPAGRAVSPTVEAPQASFAGPSSEPPAGPAPPSPAISAPLPEPPAAPSPGAPVPGSPAPTTPAPGTVTREALRLSQRIVLHLARQGFLGPDEVAGVGFTQLGMSETLGVRQNALTNVLRRLVAAGVLSEDVRHVRGQPRRLKVYRLTSRGEALAKELRRTTGSHRPEEPAPGGDRAAPEDGRDPSTPSG